MDIFYIVVLVGVGVAKWLVYTGLLWLMIKIQKLNYNVLGLFASSLAATACGYIPVFGNYIGWAVLILCLWKCTGAEIAPDVLFTVAIAGALMFCVNLFAIGALMTHLGFGAMDVAAGDDLEGDEAEFTEQVDAPDATEPAPGKTNRFQMPKIPWITKAKPAPAIPAATVASTESTPTPKLTNLTTAIAAPKPASSPAKQSAQARQIRSQLVLKGLGVTAKHKSAMIAEGGQIHTVSPGDTLTIPVGGVSISMLCEEISAASVTLALPEGERLELRFR